MDDRNLHVVLEELRALLSDQHTSLDLLSNKLNWILVSNVFLLSTLLFSSQSPNIIPCCLLVFSIIVVLIAFQPKAFRSAARTIDQLTQYEDRQFLQSLIDKKLDDYAANAKRITNVSHAFLWSSVLLVVALALQSVYFFYDIIKAGNGIS